MQSAESLVVKYVQEPVWAVVGASNDRAKYGNRIYRRLREAGYRVYPVNNRHDRVEGDTAYAALLHLPETPTVVNMVVPPGEALEVVRSAKAAGASAVWFQPGAEEAGAMRWAREQGMDVVESCILVQLALRPPSFAAGSPFRPGTGRGAPPPGPASSAR